MKITRLFWKVGLLDARRFPDNKVRVTCMDCKQFLFNGHLENFYDFYDIVSIHLIIRVPHCQEKACELLTGENENKIILPIVMNPYLSFMGFESVEEPLYINWF